MSLTPTVTPEGVRDALHQVLDPELDLDIVDLGLVYGVEVIGTRVFVRMTLTTPLCPINELLTASVRDVVRALPGVTDVSVDLVWTPPWRPDMVSQEGRQKLGW
jgi:metal-sulfur cluster biosynthetic enzyme